MFVWQRHDGFVIHLPLFINEYHFYSYCRPYLLQSIFTNWPIPASILFYFRPFHITIQKKIEKAKMFCLGFEPVAKGWLEQMDPLSYGGPKHCCRLLYIVQLPYKIINFQLNEHLRDSNPTLIPLSPGLVACGVDPRSSSYFPSNTLPLKLSFLSGSNEVIPAIFKVGDDLRQDQLTIQMIRLVFLISVKGCVFSQNYVALSSLIMRACAKAWVIFENILPHVV